MLISYLMMLSRGRGTASLPSIQLATGYTALQNDAVNGSNPPAFTGAKMVGGSLGVGAAIPKSVQSAVRGGTAPLSALVTKRRTNSLAKPRRKAGRGAISANPWWNSKKDAIIWRGKFNYNLLMKDLLGY
jgi:hypothetical protein